MTGKALICQLGELEPIEGADNICQVHMFGETLIVNKNAKKGTVGLLFDCETQLSHEFCYENDLYRHNHLNKRPDNAGYIEDNRRVRPIRLKGVKCSGMFMPIESVYFTGAKETDFIIGEEIEEVNGVPICTKYITQKTRNAQGNKQGKAREVLAPTFKEHFDTDQIMRNLSEIKRDSYIVITEKVHGTSCRCGLLPAKEKLNIWETFLGFLSDFHWDDTILIPKFVTGSRRVVKYVEGEEVLQRSSYYDVDLWTDISKRYFEHKLHEGETVYFEIVGNLPGGEPIMPGHSIDKLKSFVDKDYFKQLKSKYDTVNFNYGCGQHDAEVYVYRITFTNEEGESIDYSWEQVKTRCEQLAVNHVPELWRGMGRELVGEQSVEDDRDFYKNIENSLTDFTDDDNSTFQGQFKEGICVRIEDGHMTPKVYKNKSYLFKVLEGIIKEKDIIDLEESN